MAFPAHAPTEERNLAFIIALNNVAAALQKSARTETAVFDAFKTQLHTLNVTASISMLTVDGSFTIKAVCLPGDIQHRLEKIAGIRINGFRHSADIPPYPTVLQKQNTVFLENNNGLIADLVPKPLQFVAKSALKFLGNHKAIFAPVTIEDKVVGVVNIAHPNLTEKEVPAVTAFANQLSTALENARLIQTLQAEIARRKQTETWLLASERRYRMLIEHAPVAIAIHDGEIMRFVNPALKKMLNIERDSDVVGHSIWKFIASQSTPKAAERIKEVVHQGLSVPPMEEQFVAPDGKIIEVEAIGAPVVFEGRAASLVVFHELSLQKQAQRQLEHRLSQLTLLNEIGREISTMLNLNQLFARTTHLIHQKFGYHHVAIFTRDDGAEAMVMQARAGGYAALFPPNHTLKFSSGMVGWVATHNQTRVANDVSQEPYYLNPFPDQPQIRTRSELTIPLAVSGVVEGVLDIQSPRLNAFDEEQVMVLETLAQQLSAAIENARFFDATAAELAERRRAEMELRRTNRQLHLLNKIISVTATSPKLSDALIALCREFAIALNVEWGGIITVEPDAASGTIVATHRLDGHDTNIPPNTHLPFTEPITGWLKSPYPVTINNVTSTWKLQDILPDAPKIPANIWTLFVPIIDDGKTVGILAAGSTIPREFSTADISLAERVAEQLAGIIARIRLENIRERLTAAMEQSTEGIAITDNVGRITYANPALAQLSGYKLAELVGSVPIYLVEEETAEAIGVALRAEKMWQGEIDLFTKDGKTFTGETVIMPIHPAGTQTTDFVVTIKDITRQITLEEQLRQSQKLEAVGQLAAGIAHDFNNLLTAVNGFSELLLERVKIGSLEHEYVLQILESGNRAAELVRQLLAFSRKQLIKPQVVNLNQVVLDMQKMLRRVISEHISIETSLAPAIYPLKLDPTQIEQVILNLAVNAEDAMPNGGSLRISTENVLLSSEYTDTRPDIEAGEYVCLSIADTGTGIEPEVLEHIFEPFFTTKDVGKGTGLGLASVYGIVKQNRGHIDVTSTPGEGTTFHIYLPRTPDAATAPPLDISSEMPVGTESIVLVEDSEHVLDLAQTILSEMGYSVITALTAEQAIERAKTLENPPDLLITDIVLPRMNGLILASAMQDLFPDIKILYISGYNESTLPINIHQLDDNAGFMEKPFTAAQLAHTVREILDR